MDERLPHQNRTIKLKTNSRGAGQGKVNIGLIEWVTLLAWQHCLPDNTACLGLSSWNLLPLGQKWSSMLEGQHVTNPPTLRGSLCMQKTSIQRARRMENDFLPCNVHGYLPTLHPPSPSLSPSLPLSSLFLYEPRSSALTLSSSQI